MANKTNNVHVKLSNATNDNGKTINSKDGFVVKKGEDQNISGTEMDISGVSSGAQVSANVGENSIDLSLDSAWNSVKNVQVNSKQAADVSIDNFVDVRVRTGGDEDSSVEVTGAKRGNIQTGRGDDNISVDAQSNGSGWSNQFQINAGSGNDTMTLNGDGGHSFFKVNAGFGDDVVRMIGDDYAGSNVDLGSGNDTFEGGTGTDAVRSRFGDNNISTGDGEDLILTGNGNDTLDGGVGVDRVSAGSGDDTVKFDAEDSRIDGGRGNDTLVVDGHMDTDTQQVRRFENIEMTDDEGDDSVAITLEQARKMSDNDIVKIKGDMGDEVEPFDYVNQLDDVSENGIEFSVFEGSKGQQIWVQHGLSVGEDVVGMNDAPQAGDDGLQSAVVLGSKENAGSVEDWGTANADGSISFDKGGVTGTVRGFDKKGDTADVEYSVGKSGGGKNDFGLGVGGGGSQEVDLDESLVVDFDVPVAGAQIGLDSLFSHFNEGSSQGAHVEWQATLNGVVVAQGSVINDPDNVDGDGLRETNIIDIDQQFDSITLVTDANVNSNFVLRYIDVDTSEGYPAAEGQPLTLDSGLLLANDKDVDGDVLNITEVDAISENGGTVALNPETGEVVYTSADDFSGQDSFTYIVSDGNGGFDTATVYVNVAPNAAPVATDDGVSETVLLGTEDGQGGMAAWGDLQQDGTVTFDKDGVTGSIEAIDEDGDAVKFKFETRYDGLGTQGGRSSEVDLDESIVVRFDDAVEGAEVGLDSLLGHYDEGSSQGARVVWQAFKDGELVSEGEVFSDQYNTDGDGVRATNHFDVEESFDSLVLTTEANTSSNFVLKYIEVTKSSSITAEEGEPLVLDDAALLANDFDPDGDPLSIINVSATSENGGTVELDPQTGEVTYTSADGFAGKDTFTYTISDGDGGESTATVHVNVQEGSTSPDPVNEAPVAIADAMVVDEDSSGTITVTEIIANDTDADGDTVTLTGLQDTSLNGGSVELNEETGEITYTPNADFNGQDSFNYTISDGNGGVSSGTINITVNPVYDAPEAEAISATAVEDGSLVVLDASVLNVDNLDLFYSLASRTDEGTVINNGDGTFTFDVGGAFQDLDSGEVRHVTFTYQVTDLAGNSSVADAVITVAGVNDTPTAVDVPFTFTEDTVQSVTGTYNVSDVDDEPLTINLLGQLDAATEGTVVDNGDGTFGFTPATDPEAYNYLSAGEQLVLEVAYSVTDGDETTTANIQFVINGVDDAIEAEEVIIGDDEVITDDGQDIVIDLNPVVNDPDGDVTITIPNQPAPEEGEIVDNGDGTFTFEPSPELEALDDGESQEIVIEYEVTDEEGNAVTETITIIVTGSNDAPVAENVTIVTNEDDSAVATFSATDVDANDTLTYSVVDAPDPATEGTVEVSGSDFTFHPAASLNALAVGETVDVTFTYRASDGDATDDATVTVTVVGTNDAPVVESVVMSATETQASAQVDIRDFINDVDSDDDASTLTYAINQPSKGELVDLGNGVLEFRPNGEFENLASDDTFVTNVPVVVTDSHGTSTTLNIMVSVQGENAAPVVSNVSVQTTEDTSSMSFVIPASDVDGDGLDVQFVDVPDEINLSVSGLNASVATNPALQSLDDGETLTFDVVYTVSDGMETVQGVVTVTVQGSNDAPIIESVATSMTENQLSVTESLTGTDFEGDSITYLIQNPPVNLDGYVTIDNINETFTFYGGDSLDELQVGETKVVQFTYVATDGKDTSAPQTIQVTIQGENDAPVVASVAEVIGEDDGTQTFSLGVTDVDNNISELTFTLDEEPTNATVVLNGDGTFSVTPGSELQALNDGETALVEFTYSVSDGENTVQQTALVTVVGATDAPLVNSAFFDDPFQAVERFELAFNLNDAFDNLTGSETVTFADEFGGAAPSFVRYDEASGKVIILTGVNDYGEYDIQIHVSDDTGTDLTQQFKLFVNEAGASLDANAIITGSTGDVINGTALGEYISSDGGDDTIIAGDGNDVIFAGSGSDYMVGGDGDDTFLLEGSFVNDGINEYHGGEGYDSIVFHSGGSRTMYIDGTFNALSSIEEIRSTQDGIGSIRGLGNDDNIDLSSVHLEGTFRIYAGSGNDTIVGSAGDDLLIYGQAGNDTIDGYLGNDTIRGDAGNDTLYGGEGDDHLTGGADMDELYGGAGNDTLVWDGDDTVIDGGVGGFDTLDLTGQSTVDFTLEPTNERGFESIDMSGSATEITLGLADVLEIKDTTIDTLYIEGGSGDNVVTGGAFEATAQIDVVDTTGDGNTDTTFQVYRSTLQSDVFIGLEMGVNMSIDGTIV